jgi:hypothetical protein
MCYNAGHDKIMAKEKENLIEKAQNLTKESKQLDFKESFDPQSSQDWARIIKDIIAMANSGGGIILFGVKDDGSLATFDSNTFLDIDPATIADKINAYTKEDFCDFEIIEIKRNGTKIAALIISPSNYPIIFTKAGSDVVENGKQKPAFTRGSMYFRHGAKSEPGTNTDIKNSIEKALNQIKKSWFKGVRKIANIQAGEEVIISKAQEKKQTSFQKIVGKIVTDKNALPVQVENPRETWPDRSKELTAKITEILKTKKPINSHDILCVRKQYGFNEKTKPEFIYKPYPDVSPRYSHSFADWIVYSYKKNPHFFEEARAYFKKSTKHD